MCIASTLADKVDPASWIMRKQGYAGATNPANILRTRLEEKTLGIGDGRTETERRADTMNRTPEAQRKFQPRHSGQAAHAQLIEAGNNIQIAGRRGPGRG